MVQAAAISSRRSANNQSTLDWIVGTEQGSEFTHICLVYPIVVPSVRDFSLRVHYTRARQIWRLADLATSKSEPQPTELDIEMYATHRLGRPMLYMCAAESKERNKVSSGFKLLRLFADSVLCEPPIIGLNFVITAP